MLFIVFYLYLSRLRQLMVMGYNDLFFSKEDTL